jgi:hypothetical protein
MFTIPEAPLPGKGPSCVEVHRGLDFIHPFPLPCFSPEVPETCQVFETWQVCFFVPSGQVYYREHRKLEN